MKKNLLFLGLCMAFPWACLLAKVSDGDRAKAGVSHVFIASEESTDQMKIKDQERAQEIFDSAWNAVSKEYKTRRMKMKFPAKMVWLNGAPGSGKGTNTSSVMRALDISSRPMVVSSLLDSPEDQSIKESGKLVDDEKVVRLVLRALLHREYANGVVIDGFPRTRVQAICLKLLIKKLREDERNSSCSFRVINFTVSRESSVARQLKRGQDAIEHNKLVRAHLRSEELIPVRETDLSEEMANFRYRTYEDKMRECVGILSEMPEYCEVNTEGSLEDVRKRIYDVLAN